jgi:hypothetical protein
MEEKLERSFAFLVVRDTFGREVNVTRRFDVEWCLAVKKPDCLNSCGGSEDVGRRSDSSKVTGGA